METFSQRLTGLRTDVGIERKSLALMAGISESELTAIEEGYSDPRIDLLQRLAQIFGVSLAYICLLTDDPSVCKDKSLYETLIFSSPLVGKMTRRDVIGVSYIYKNNLHGRDAAGRLMPDESMEELISKGDRVIFRLQHTADNTDIVLANTDQGELIRRYEKRGNVVILKPENPLFDEVKINTDSENFELIGVAAEMHRVL